MIIVWDEPKRLSTLGRRGLDFADLDDEFFASAMVTPVKQSRLRAVGFLGDVIITVIYRPLGTEAVSIISMRTASRKERAQL